VAKVKMILLYLSIERQEVQERFLLWIGFIVK